jgi:hypothetical protein
MTSLKFGLGESCEFVFVHGSFMHQKCSNYALTNLLFGLCKFVWIIDSLVTRPHPHLGALARPSTLKCYEPKSVPNSLSFYCFTLDPHLTRSRSLGVHHSSLLEFCNILLMRFCASLVCTSWRVINAS